MHRTQAIPAKTSKKKVVSEDTVERKCPVCKAMGVLKEGYEENMFYVKCPNNCCVTKYAKTKEEALNLWNRGRMVLTFQERQRVGSYRPPLITERGAKK